MPKVSIILPTYNRRALLERAIGSILSQSFEDWELIVINDASTDDTREFLDAAAKKDRRIRPVHNEKNNYPDISKNLNYGIRISHGEYIARLDDDDYWCDDDKLKKQADFLHAHPDVVVVGGGTIVIDAKGNERFRYFKLENDAAIRDKVLFANPFTHSTVMFRRTVALDVGGYGNFKNAEDWDLWLKMGLRGAFYNFRDYFVRYTMDINSKTFLHKRSQSDEILRIIRAHRREYPHYAAAFALNFAQYCYSFLPGSMQLALYTTLLRAKRTLFQNN